MTDQPIPRGGEPVTAIRNIGPAMEQALAGIGITSAELIRELGADEAYARLVAGGHRPHFIGYYALVMGLQGRPWNDCRGAEKDALRLRFDAIVAGAAPDAATDAAFGIERSLDEIGTGRRR